MSFQGHIEKGVVVLDEPLSLPNGTVVRIEAVHPLSPATADTHQPHTLQEMANAWTVVSKPIMRDETPLPVDPDDYPLF